MLINEFVSKLKVKLIRKDGRYIAACPVKEDKSGDRLNVKQDFDTVTGAGKIILKCHHGCSTESILSAIGLSMKDLFEKSEEYVKSQEEVSDDDIGARHEIYEEMLDMLVLDSKHHSDLLRRGLDDEAIGLLGFKTFDGKKITKLRPKMLVPGYTVERGWKNVSGCLIPVRNKDQRIWALKVANDSRDPKYIWYSSEGALGKVYSWNGPSDAKRIRIVEGVLKAIVSHFLAPYDHELATVGVGGIGSWGNIVNGFNPVKGFNYFSIAYDQDGKKDTGDQIEKMRDAIVEKGCKVKVDIWDNADDTAKGFDDALLLKKPVSSIGWARNESKPRGLPGGALGNYGGLNARRASEIPVEEIDWVIPRWFPRGYFCHLSGQPGVGKGLVTGLFAAAITTGNAFMNFPSRPPATVCIINREDRAASVIVPRLKKQNCNMDRTWVIDGSKENENFMFSLPKYVDRLEDLIKDTGSDVIFIDPLPSFLDEGTKYSDDSSSRPIVVKLAELAKRTNTCIFGVFHLTKGFDSIGINKPAGAICWMGESRKAFLIEADAENPDKRYIVNTKSNLDKLLPPYEVQLFSRTGEEKDQKLVWDQVSQLSADKILNMHSFKKR